MREKELFQAQSDECSECQEAMRVATIKQEKYEREVALERQKLWESVKNVVKPATKDTMSATNVVGKMERVRVEDSQRSKVIK